MLATAPEAFFELLNRRPRVALRRVSDPILHCAVRAFAGNWRDPPAKAAMLETIKMILREGKGQND